MVFPFIGSLGRVLKSSALRYHRTHDFSMAERCLDDFHPLPDLSTRHRSSWPGGEGGYQMAAAYTAERLRLSPSSA